MNRFQLSWGQGGDGGVCGLGREDDSNAYANARREESQEFGEFKVVQ